MVRQRLQAASREVAAKPREAEVNGRFGMLLHAYKQYELALPCYQRARLLEPESFRWVYYLGTLERRLGNQTEAVGTLRKAIQLNPDYVPAQLALGEALLAIGEWEESRKVYAAHLKRYPNSALAHYGLGRIQTARRQPRTAAASFRNALALFPRFGAVHYALAMIYRDLGEPSKSLHHLSVFERNREGIPPVDDPLMGEIEARKVGARYHFSRGVKFQKRGEMRQAAVEFEGALEANPKFAPAHASLLSTYLALGESGRAEEHYYAALRLNPDMYELHHNFGILMSLRGKPDEASKAFRRALEINPLYAESHNNLGFLLADQGRLTEAIRHLRLAIESKPHFRLPHFRLGQVLLDQGKTPEAIAHLLKTLGVEDEQTPLFLYTLADAYAGAGDSQKAAHYAQQAIARAVPLGQTEVAADVENLLKELKWAGQELFSQQQDPSVTIYREIAEEAGLNFEHYIGASGEFFLPEIMGSGVALFDYDGDGDLDVYFLQGALLDQKKSPGESVFPPSTDEPPGNKLFRNRLVEDGRLRFDDVTGRAGVGETGYGMGVASGDYDNDGDPDLYVTNFGQNVLYRNNGDGTFTNVASRAGIGHLRWSTSAAFLDYDLDGDLDLFVTNYVDFQVRGNKECANAAGQRDYCNPDAYDPLPDRLFRNQGSGQFVDVTEDSGIGTTFGPGLGVVCADFNSDGWIDIFVANDGSANQLWMNKGDGTFQERALFSGTAYSGGGMAEAGPDE